jgi:hypothetical protein
MPPAIPATSAEDAEAALGVFFMLNLTATMNM